MWVALCACVSEPDAAPVVTAATFALERAQALCAQRAECCRAGEDSDFDEASCTRAETEDYRRFMAALRADFMPDAAESCVAAYRLSCPESDAAVERVCARVWRGRQPPDAECEVDAECAAIQGVVTRCRSFVEDDGGAMVSRKRSRCVADEHARENFNRAGLREECLGQCNGGPSGRCSGQLGQRSPTPACFEADGLICLEGRCEELPGAEADCVLGRCDSRVSYCDADGRCRERQPEGGPCQLAGECAGGNYCASETARCVPFLPLGEACASAAECESGLCEETCIAAHPLLCGQPQAAELEP